MSLQKAIMGQVLVKGLLGPLAPTPLYQKILTGLCILSGFLLVVAFGFGLYAAFLQLNLYYDLPTAMALMGLVVFGLSLAVAFAALGVVQYQKSKMEKMKKDVLKAVSSVFETLDKEVSKPVNDNPKTSMVTALMAGYAAGRKL